MNGNQNNCDGEFPVASKPLGDGTTFLVTHPGEFRMPEIHVAVWHGAHPEICDSCSLKGDCDSLFGTNGKDCKIHSKGMRWSKLTQDQCQSIAEITRYPSSGNNQSL